MFRGSRRRGEAARSVVMVVSIEADPRPHHPFTSDWAGQPIPLDGVNENIPRVVEMDELLQALYIAIMKERLLEGGTIGRRHRRIARRGYLHLAVDARRILDPLAVRVDAGKAPEEQAHAQIIEAAVIAMARDIATAVDSAGLLPQAEGGAGASGGVIKARMAFLEEKGCVSWDISAAPRRSGREYYGNEPK